MAKLLKTLLVRTASIAINAQLVISPMAIANDNTTEVNAWDKIANAAQAIGSVAQTGMQFINQRQATPLLQSHLLQTVQADTMHPVLQRYGCSVLEAKGDQLSLNAICNVESPNIQNQAQMIQYAATATANMSTVDEYLIKGNNKYSQGPACFDRAALGYQQELKAKLKNLDDLENAMVNKIKAFKVQGDKMINAIKADDAILNGANGDIKLDSHEFMTTFSPQERKQCATFINQNSIQSDGKEKGLRGLETSMLQRFEESSDGSYSPNQVLTNSRQIRSDVDSLLENFQSNITGTDSITLDTEELYSGAETTLLDENNKGIETVLKNELKSFDRTLRDKKKQFKGVDTLLAQIEDGTESSSDIAAIYKRDQYNACVARYVGSSKSFAKKITNYSLTKAANKNRDSILRTTVYENLEDNDISIEQKIANISSYDSSSQERIRLSRTQTLCGKTIYKDASNVSVSSLLSLYKCECEKIYNSVSSGTTSPSQTEALLAGYTQYIADEKSKLMSSIANKVKEKILNCNEDQTTGVGALSCDGAFNKTSKNFCLATAQKCAGNIQSCAASVEKAVKFTEASQANKAKIYVDEMEAMKKEIFTSLQGAIALTQIDGLNSDAQNQTGSLALTPKDLQMDLVQNKLIEGLDPKLIIEDPDTYLELMKEDMKKIRTALVASTTQLFGADVENFTGYASKTSSTQGLLGAISTAMENAKEEKSRWSEVEGQCNSANNRIKQMINDQNLANQEAAQKQQEQQDYNLKKCQILEYGCKDSQFQSLGSNISSITEAMNGSRKSDPYKDLCSGNSSDPDDEIAELIAAENINVQKLKIITYCQSEQLESSFYNECDKILGVSATDNQAEKEPSTFCSSYEPEDMYADIDFCIEEVNTKEALNIKGSAKMGECKSNQLSKGYKTISLSGFTAYENGDQKREDAEKLASKSSDKKCITPKDKNMELLAKAAYTHSANKSPEFAGYGESVLKEQCQAIIANSTGSGDKDEGWAASLLDGFNSQIGSSTLQK